MAGAESGPEAVRAQAWGTTPAQPGRGIIQDIERAIPTAEVDRSDLPV